MQHRHRAQSLSACITFARRKPRAMRGFALRSTETTAVEQSKRPVAREGEQIARWSTVAEQEEPHPERHTYRHGVATPRAPEGERGHPKKEVEQLQPENSARPFDAAID